jgi:cation diffusion facilitator CzcD-associated flavoprotein CzcO
VKSNLYWHLEEYKDFMRQRCQSGDTTKSFTPRATTGSSRMMVNMAQWQTQGFPSAGAANLVTTIANATTAPTARNGCLAALVHSLATPKIKDPHVH